MVHRFLKLSDTSRESRLGKLYIPELDGIRGLAVIFVMLNHANIQYFFTGGYIGVDIFFVISGYVITKLLIHNGVMSIFTFYERRIRRLYPSLILVISVSYITGFFILYQEGWMKFVRSGISCLTFSSNFFFSKTGYFDQSSEFSPLLHTWSLSIEEQFYFIFPFLLPIFFSKESFKRKFYFLYLIFFFSFSLSVIASNFAPTQNYYSIVTRGWELIIGVILAGVIQKADEAKISKNLWSITFVFSLILIFYAALFFQSSTKVPGFPGLIPTFATAALITSSKYTRQAKILRSKILVYIGLISYEIYLWHQPIFAFWKISTGREISFLTLASLSLIIFFISIFTREVFASYFKNRILKNKTLTFTIFLISSIFLISVFAISPKTNYATIGYKHYFQNNQVLFQIDDLARKRNQNCLIENLQNKDRIPCNFNFFDDRKKLLLWGDSHAASLANGLISLNSFNIQQETMVSCPPLLHVNFARNKYCLNFNNYVVKVINEFRPDVIVLLANWNQSSFLKLNVIIQQTVLLVHKLSPESKIVVLGGLPQWGIPLPDMFVRNNTKIHGYLRTFNFGLNEIQESDAALRSSLTGSPAIFISITDLVCKNRLCISVVKNENNKLAATAFDYAHLTTSGSLFYVKKIIQSGDFPR